MYCKNCGKYLVDNARFCDGCGTPQTPQPMPQQPAPQYTKPQKSNKGLLIIIGVCALLILVAVLALGFGGSDDADPKVKRPSSSAAPTEAPPRETEASPPSNGWFDANGERYYYENGQPLTGFQEINGDYYFFYDDGSMAANTTIEGEDLTLEVGRDGRATGVTFDIIDGNWSDEELNYGYNGRASIKELEMEVFNCDRTGFYLEAEGQYGANVGGTWKVYVRSYGEWIMVQEINFTQPDGYFVIEFDEPMDFDAVSAHPTVTGNASYNFYFALADVHMNF